MNKLLSALFILSIITSPSLARNNPYIADSLNGIVSDKCIKKIRQVEIKLMPDLPMRTHPVVNKTNPAEKVFSATTIVNYNGNDSQVNITAIPTANSCTVIFMETFVRKEPCMISREKIFKKWTFMGKMQESMVFKFRRDDQYFGYLTPQGFNSTCLISKRRVFY